MKAFKFRAEQYYYSTAFQQSPRRVTTVCPRKTSGGEKTAAMPKPPQAQSLRNEQITVLLRQTNPAVEEQLSRLAERITDREPVAEEASAVKLRLS
ncbi:MAG: hypothetical protein IPP46_06120 [Bacteroidetes bacterium]|nr:hypothetical protein [Bacteroidota bacterium]